VYKPIDGPDNRPQDDQQQSQADGPSEPSWESRGTLTGRDCLQYSQGLLIVLVTKDGYGSGRMGCEGEVPGLNGLYALPSSEIRRLSASERSWVLRTCFTR
jgi:hypothetical protein